MAMRRLNRRALLSGALGATASCIAKLALDPTSPVPSPVGRACRSRLEWIPSAVAAVLYSPDHACVGAELLARGVCLLFMVGCNALMMGTFLDGMEESGSVAATGLATAANFSASALYGIVLFHETVNMTWLLGFAMIVAGVLMLSTVRLRTSSSLALR